MQQAQKPFFYLVKN
uniref:Uncharacterized protein n=1 Tax=Anguilla anguilla TaxID=7936 RepID=A0A0E9SHL9_ANGAN